MILLNIIMTYLLVGKTRADNTGLFGYARLVTSYFTLFLREHQSLLDTISERLRLSIIYSSNILFTVVLQV